MMKLVAMVVLLASALLIQNGNAFAQEDRKKCPEQTNEGNSGQKYEKVKGPDGRVVYKIVGVFCIEGKVPKPSVIYVLNASTINYEWDTLKQDFLGKVLKSVEKTPF